VVEDDSGGGEEEDLRRGNLREATPLRASHPEKYCEEEVDGVDGGERPGEEEEEDGDEEEES